MRISKTLNLSDSPIWVIGYGKNSQIMCELTVGRSAIIYCKASTIKMAKVLSDEFNNNPDKTYAMTLTKGTMDIKLMLLVFKQIKHDNVIFALVEDEKHKQKYSEKRFHQLIDVLRSKNNWQGLLEEIKESVQLLNKIHLKDKK